MGDLNSPDPHPENEVHQGGNDDLPHHLFCPNFFAALFVKDLHSDLGKQAFQNQCTRKLASLKKMHIFIEKFVHAQLGQSKI